VRAFGLKPAWLTIKRSLITLYNDVYDEHLFVFAAGLSYYFVLSLFPLLVTMASLLGYVPIPHLFEGLLSLMSRLVPGDGMSLVRSIVSDVISHKHPHFLTLGLVFTIWAASSGFAAIIDSLDVVYRTQHYSPHIRQDRGTPCRLAVWNRINTEDKRCIVQRIPARRPRANHGISIPKTRISRSSRDISLFTWASSFERARLLISRPAISISCVGCLFVSVRANARLTD
jgi:hypothetical protein